MRGCGQPWSVHRTAEPPGAAGGGSKPHDGADFLAERQHVVHREAVRGGVMTMKRGGGRVDLGGRQESGRHVAYLAAESETEPEIVRPVAIDGVDAVAPQAVARRLAGVGEIGIHAGGRAPYNAVEREADPEIIGGVGLQIENAVAVVGDVGIGNVRPGGGAQVELVQAPAVGSRPNWLSPSMAIEVTWLLVSCPLVLGTVVYCATFEPSAEWSLYTPWPRVATQRLPAASRRRSRTFTPAREGMLVKTVVLGLKRASPWSVPNQMTSLAES